MIQNKERFSSQDTNSLHKSLKLTTYSPTKLRTSVWGLIAVNKWRTKVENELRI